MTDAAQQHVAVMNEAFLSLGGQSLQTFEDDEDVWRRYQTVVGDVLQHTAFPFSVMRVQLNRLSGAPNSGYAWQFYSPVGGDIGAIYRDATTQVAFTEFRIFANNQIHSDEEELWAEVITGALPETWPNYVRNAVVGALKAEFCFSISGDAREAQRLSQLAWGSPGVDYPNGGLVGAARARASQQQGGGVLVMGPDYLTGARYR